MAIQEKEVLPSNEKIVLEVGTYNEDFFNIVAEDGHMLAQPIQKDTLQVAPGVELAQKKVLTKVGN